MGFPSLSRTLTGSLLSPSWYANVHQNLSMIKNIPSPYIFLVASLCINVGIFECRFRMNLVGWRPSTPFLFIIMGQFREW